MQLGNAVFCAERARGSKLGVRRGVHTRARLSLSLSRTPHQHQSPVLPPHEYCFALLPWAARCLLCLVSAYAVSATPLGWCCHLEVWGGGFGSPVKMPHGLLLGWYGVVLGGVHQECTLL